MKIVKGDLWVYPADIRIVSTNGSVRGDGCAVMGRGCAFEAAQRYIMLPRKLGVMLKKHGNHVFSFPDCNIITFPVKHQWHEDADLQLIERSVKELRQFLQVGKRYVAPRFGCGNGRLQWEDVKPLLVGLPDSVRVIHYE